MEPWARPGTNANPVGQLHADHRSRRRQLPDDAGRAQVRAGLHSENRQHQSRRLQPVPRPHRPRRRRAGAEGRQRHPAEGADRQTRRHPLLLGGGNRAPPRQQRRSRAGHPSCSAASLIGTTSTESGTGANPLNLGGKAYLAGPYKGAPLSLVVITPAVAGPFDLGTVVVRVALNVNPETAQINAVSDVIPDVFGGVKLDIRAIDVNVDRSQFMLNPTNCAAQATSGTINGRRRRPGQPGGVQLLRRQRRRSRRPNATNWLQAEAVHPAVRADQAGQEPAPPGDPESPQRRRQHRPHGADACRARCSSTRATSARSARGRSWPRSTARRARSTARRKRNRRCSTSKLKGPVYLVVLRRHSCRTWSPTCAAR